MSSEKLLAALDAATSTTQRARQVAWAESDGIMEMSAQDGVVTAALPRTAPTSSLETSRATMRTAGLGGTVVVKRSTLPKAELDATLTQSVADVRASNQLTPLINTSRSCSGRSPGGGLGSVGDPRPPVWRYAVV